MQSVNVFTKREFADGSFWLCVVRKQELRHLLRETPLIDTRGPFSCVRRSSWKLWSETWHEDRKQENIQLQLWISDGLAHLCLSRMYAKLHPPAPPLSQPSFVVGCFAALLDRALLWVLFKTCMSRMREECVNNRFSLSYQQNCTSTLQPTPTWLHPHTFTHIQLWLFEGSDVGDATVSLFPVGRLSTCLFFHEGSVCRLFEIDC